MRHETNTYPHETNTWRGRSNVALSFPPMEADPCNLTMFLKDHFLFSMSCFPPREVFEILFPSSNCSWLLGPNSLLIVPLSLKVPTPSSQRLHLWGHVSLLKGDFDFEVFLSQRYVSPDIIPSFWSQGPGSLLQMLIEVLIPSLGCSLPPRSWTLFWTPLLSRFSFSPWGNHPLEVMFPSLRRCWSVSPHSISLKHFEPYLEPTLLVGGGTPSSSKNWYSSCGIPGFPSDSGLACSNDRLRLHSRSHP